MNTPEETRLADFIFDSNLALLRMRVLTEGASYLCTEEASSLYHLGVNHNQHEAAQAFSAIGLALNDLCEELSALQQAYIEELKRQWDSL